MCRTAYKETQLMIYATTKETMEGYDVDGASVYNKLGSALRLSELQTLMCSICGYILRDAMQVTQCGHRSCRACIDKLMNEREDYMCPVDNERFTKLEVRRDKGCQKEVDSLEVDCPTKPNACKWRGSLKEIEVHRLECPRALVSCTHKCGLDLSRDELTSHLNSQCPRQPVDCTHCKESFPRNTIESHLESCPESPAVCEYCQLKVSSKKLMRQHLESSCTNYEMKCPLNCSNFAGKRSSMNEHLKSHSLDIAQLLLATLTRVEHLETKQHESDRTIATLTEKLEKAEVKGSIMEKKITELELKLGRFDKADSEDSHSALHTQSMVERPQKSKDTHSATPLNSANHVRNGATKLGPDKVLRADNVETGHMKEEIKSHDTQLLKMSETLHTVQTQLTQYAVAIDDVRLRQDILDVKVTNGLLIWKIPDIRRRYRDAVDRRTISLYSPPFYTSPHGYRMCIRTYLNGDGMGKGTHLSLFFVIMRSEQDNLLTWPFKQSVRFTLVNQKNQAASITEAFVPDSKSPSFQKPENDMNVASGFPKFARQSVLQEDNFTLGNMIYIKCHVDTTGLNFN